MDQRQDDLLVDPEGIQPKDVQRFAVGKEKVDRWNFFFSCWKIQWKLTHQLQSLDRFLLESYFEYPPTSLFPMILTRCGRNPLPFLKSLEVSHKLNFPICSSVLLPVAGAAFLQGVLDGVCERERRSDIVKICMTLEGCLVYDRFEFGAVEK